jgi:hypothetical protein
VIAFKPSFAPFLLIGVRRRSWWLAMGLVAVLSLAMLSEWLRYVTVLQNLESPGILYSLGDLPLLVVPVIAWAARRRPAELMRGIDPLGEALASGRQDLRRDRLDGVGDEGIAQR